MSDETYNRLQEAISAHVGDELGEDVSLIKDWVLVASVSDMDSFDGMEKIMVHRSTHTALYAVSGLLQWGAMTMVPEDLAESD